MTRVYYRQAVAALIVFDLSNRKSFDVGAGTIASVKVAYHILLQAVLTWKDDLDSKVSLANGSNVPCMLLGNKVMHACDKSK